MIVHQRANEEIGAILDDTLRECVREIVGRTPGILAAEVWKVTCGKSMSSEDVARMMRAVAIEWGGALVAPPPKKNPIEDVVAGLALLSQAIRTAEIFRADTKKLLRLRTDARSALSLFAASNTIVGEAERMALDQSAILADTGQRISATVVDAWREAWERYAMVIPDPPSTRRTSGQHR